MTIDAHGVTIDLPVYAASAQSLRKSLTAMTVGGGLFKRPDNVVSVRALDNINLTISDGDRVGIVGPNGAGKTTLLKVLAGIYTPSQGYVTVKGRVSSALNVSLGLDMEISGRDNIYLLGYYRGLSRQTIMDQIDEIVEATQLGPFIELPINTYSSGMLGRLTFAVATAFEPDVLLMDEWLMAGDTKFINDASARVQKFVQKARILVIATHSTSIMREFCTKGAYLNGGRLMHYGSVDDAIGHYEHHTSAT